MDPRVSGLVEGQDPNPESGVLADQLEGLLVGVERVHQDQRNVRVVTLVEPFNLRKKCSKFNFKAKFLLVQYLYVLTFQYSNKETKKNCYNDFWKVYNAKG